MQQSLAQKARDRRLQALAILRVVQNGETDHDRQMRRSPRLRRAPSPFAQVAYGQASMGFYGKSRVTKFAA